MTRKSVTSFVQSFPIDFKQLVDTCKTINPCKISDGNRLYLDKWLTLRNAYFDADRERECERERDSERLSSSASRSLLLRSRSLLLRSSRPLSSSRSSRSLDLRSLSLSPSASWSSFVESLASPLSCGLLLCERLRSRLSLRLCDLFTEMRKVSEIKFD